MGLSQVLREEMDMTPGQAVLLGEGGIPEIMVHFARLQLPSLRKKPPPPHSLVEAAMT